MKIVNASGKKIGASNGLPNMSQTIVGWFQDIVFGVVTRTIVNYESVETVTQVKTQGVVQPYKPTELEIQEAGTRSWGWQTIHCLPDLELKNNQFIYYEGVKYKVMNHLPYNKYGYREYHICETYDE